MIAADLGSCREVIEDGVTGFLVDDVPRRSRRSSGSTKSTAAPAAAGSKSDSRSETMVKGYEGVYAKIFDQED